MSYSNQFVEKITDYLYCITETNKVHQYLIIGSKKALLFDTGFGYTAIEPIIRTITDKPLIVVNSHADIDHASGNFRFKEVYISIHDLRFLADLDDKEHRKKTLLYRSSKQGANTLEEMKKENMTIESFMNWSIFDCQYHFIDDGFIFDLGDIQLQVISTPGHTNGSICLLDKTHRLLFSGDTIMSHIVYMIPSNKRAPLASYYQSLLKLKSYSDCFDYIFGGHNEFNADKSLIDEMIECLKEVYYGQSENIYNAHENAYEHHYQHVSIMFDLEGLAEFQKTPISFF